MLFGAGVETNPTEFCLKNTCGVSNTTTNFTGKIERIKEVLRASCILVGIYIYLIAQKHQQVDHHIISNATMIKRKRSWMLSKIHFPRKKKLSGISSYRIRIIVVWSCFFNFKPIHFKTWMTTVWKFIKLLCNLNLISVIILLTSGGAMPNMPDIETTPLPPYYSAIFSFSRATNSCLSLFTSLLTI